MNTLYQKNHRGFTLIETLFAVLIFSAALVALMTIAGRGISATNSAREQTLAYYLAQEGLETVRNVRDTNSLGGTFDDGFASNPNCAETTPCKVVYGSGNALPSLANCTSNSDCEVLKDPDTIYFLDDAPGLPSGYIRRVYVVPVEDHEFEYEVVSRVSWISKSIDRSVELHTILKKWQ